MVPLLILNTHPDDIPTKAAFVLFDAGQAIHKFWLENDFWWV
jgi:hypothetical protein